MARKPPSWDDDFDMDALTEGIPTAGKIGPQSQQPGQSGVISHNAGIARMKGGPIVQPDGLQPSISQPADPETTDLVPVHGPAWLGQEPVALISGLEALLTTQQCITVEQERRALEVFIGLERSNIYHVNDEYNNPLAHVKERSQGLSGFASRMFLGARRPFHAEVLDRTYKQVLLDLKRSFSFYFSEVTVETATGKFMGSVARRFGVIHRCYDLINDRGEVFATIRSPLWKIWTFPIFTPQGHEVGSISKKWNGFFKEAFTDYDKFQVDFGSFDWTLPERSVIFAAAMAIDFDHFENNHRN